MTNEIELEHNGNILTVYLNRPEKKNALNASMIKALINLTKELEHDNLTDIVVLKGKGECFCTGADLGWFKKVSDLDEQERIEQLKTLPVFFHAWHRLPQTTLTVGHGNLFGGALGLLSVSDFVILEQSCQLRLSEVLLGLIPATIAPFLIRRMGFQRTKSLMLSAEIFSAQMALTFGLADKVAPNDLLIATEQRLIADIQLSNSQTRRLAKKYMFDIVNRSIEMDLVESSTKILSIAVRSEIAQKTIDTFYDNKK